MTRRRGRSSAPIFALAAWVAGCGDAPRDLRGPSPVSLSVSFAGCDGITEGPVCRFLDASKSPTVALWVESPAAAVLSVSFAGERLDAAGTQEVGGRSFSVSLPPRASGDLVVTASLGDASSLWKLPISRVERCPEVEKARAFRAEGKVEEALAVLTALPGSLSPFCRGAALGTAASIRGFELDDPAAGVSGFKESVRVRRGAGDLLGAVRDVQSMCNLLTIKLHDFAAVRREIQGISDVTTGLAEGRTITRYVLGQLAFETGDLREALRLFEETALWAKRLGMARLLGAARTETADLLAYLGRYDEALEVVERAVEDVETNSDACRRALALGNAGWIRFLAAKHEASHGAPVDPSRAAQPTKEALAVFRSACPDPFSESISTLNLALIEFEKGDLERAATLLSSAGAKHPSPAEFAVDWMLDLEGRIALGRGKGREALKIFRSLRHRAVPFSGPALNAARGEAQALAALGRDKDAIAAYRRAEDLLDEQIGLIPVNAGQGSFLANNEDGARALVGLLLKRGATGDAFDVARRSRARLIWALQRDDLLAGLTETQRAAWERRVERYRELNRAIAERRAAFDGAARDEQASLGAELAALESSLHVAIDDIYADLPRLTRPKVAPLALEQGTIALLFFPLAEETVGFAAHEGGVVARRLPAIHVDADQKSLSGQLLEPFAELLETARRVEILAYGAFQEVDFHALDWRGAPLIHHAEVVYRLDLNAPREKAPASHRAPLVVVDPSGNLEGARMTGVHAEESFSRRGVEARFLRRDGATRRALLEGLEGTDLFLFAGHGERSGRDGWSSALILAGDERLSVADVLTLENAPSHVVLLACESGRSDGLEAKVETLGVGQAFVVAGARTAVVASRRISDALGRTYGELWLQRNEKDPVSAARAAQVELWRVDGRNDWAVFRIYAP